MPTLYAVDLAISWNPVTFNNGSAGDAGSSVNFPASPTAVNNVDPVSGAKVFDNNGDGDLDLVTDFYNTSSTPFSGYTVTINGTEYPLFVIAALPNIYVLLRPVGETWTAADLPASSNVYSGGNFDLSNFCFAAGTGIATPNGDVAVEHLSIGDDILTADDKRVAVKWIGWQTLQKWRHGPHLQPVRIRAGALGDGLPYRDLTVTADHGMVLDGYVINASALVNGSAIDWVPMAELEDSFTVYHFELEAHDVILANGAPSETFIDAAGRAAFDNHQEYLDLYGVERVIPDMDRPRISAARMLPQAIKDRLCNLDGDAGTRAA